MMLFLFNVQPRNKYDDDEDDIRSCFTTQPNTKRLSGSLFGTEMNIRYSPTVQYTEQCTVATLLLVTNLRQVSADWPS